MLLMMKGKEIHRISTCSTWCYGCVCTMTIFVKMSVKIRYNIYYNYSKLQLSDIVFPISLQKSSAVLAHVFEMELKEILDEGLLKLVIGFVDRQHMQPPKVTGTHDPVDPLDNFFTQMFKVNGKTQANHCCTIVVLTVIKYVCYVSGEVDPDSLEMQHALAHLVAVVLGTPAGHQDPPTCGTNLPPPKYTNLWYHLFSPEQLYGSFIPGFHVSRALCTCKGIFCHNEVLYSRLSKG